MFNFITGVLLMFLSLRVFINPIHHSHKSGMVVDLSMYNLNYAVAVLLLIPSYMLIKQSFSSKTNVDE